MKIKRFVDKNSRSAMAQVRAEMGGDAVILSSKTINGQVELVAAMDFDEKALNDQLDSSMLDDSRSNNQSRANRIQTTNINTQNSHVQSAISSFNNGSFDPSEKAGFSSGQSEFPLATKFTDSVAQSLNAASSQATSTSADTEDINSADLASPTLVDLQRELSHLRGLLEGELAQLSWQDMAGRPSVKAALYNRLAKLGLSRVICGAIVDKLPAKGDLESHWKKALGMLARRIRVMGDSMLNDGGIVALVGSTGVGKTTTIAKLAARFVMRHGTKQIALITTDCYRIGGQEQLQTFANYLGIPMVVATDGEQLKTALDQFSSRKMVLIDTAGMSQRDVRLYEQFATLQSVGYDITRYVVLSATAQQGSLNEVVQAFGKQALTGAMITKVDESSSLGAVLDVVVKNDLKLGYVSTGQKVPEDIMPARVDYLITKAVALMEVETKFTANRYNQDRPAGSIAV